MAVLGKLQFGNFELDPDRYELARQGRPVKLERIPMELLLLLVERRGQLVSREDIVERLWGKEVFLDTENNINAAVRKIRYALRDSTQRPAFVQTVTRKGYRFIAPVSAYGEAPPAAAVAALRLRSLRIDSLAVLPLENLSGDPSKEYFSDGMTDELIGELARISSLRVISRTSVMQYKGSRTKSLPAIARDLKVDAIVEGTVAQSGQKVRITAQLIRARDDRHLWSEKYERDLADVLALQGEVARAIAAQIRTTLTPVDQTNPAPTRKVDPEGYEAFLKGNFFLHSGLRGIAKSLEWFDRAIEREPSNSEAHSGRAEALVYASIFELRPPAAALREARTSAHLALKLDDSNAAAHNVLADVRKGYDWDLPAAEAEYQRALELNPNHLLTRLWYAECLDRMGRTDEALAESNRAVAADPVSAISHTIRAMLLFRARRYEDAIREGQQALDLDPNFINAYWWQGIAYAGARDFAKSVVVLTKGANLGDVPMVRASLGYVYGVSGDRSRALGVLRELEVLAKERYVSPVDFAQVYAGLDDADSTFQWLENACEARDGRVHQLPQPYFDGVRGDPRYANLMRRIGLPGR